MLVLTRNPGESIQIGEGPDAVVVTVLQTERGKMKLGITAPPSTTIVRQELLRLGQAVVVPAAERIRQERQGRLYGRC